MGVKPMGGTIVACCISFLILNQRHREQNKGNQVTCTGLTSLVNASRSICNDTCTTGYHFFIIGDAIELSNLEMLFFRHIGKEKISFANIDFFWGAAQRIRRSRTVLIRV
jgi:hypothetical protein